MENKTSIHNSIYESSSRSIGLHTINCSHDNNADSNLITKIRIQLAFLGKYGTKLTGTFIRKVTPLLKSSCKFIINWKTIHSNYFISLRDSTTTNYRSSLAWLQPAIFDSLKIPCVLIDLFVILNCKMSIAFYSGCRRFGQMCQKYVKFASIIFHRDFIILA